MAKISKTHHLTKRGVVKKNPRKKNSSNKIETYQATWYDSRGEVVSFNLYGADDINVEETKKKILDWMRREHLNPVRRLFAQAGIKLHDFNYYSPKYYNYTGDSMDVKISFANRAAIRRYIIENSSGIQEALDGNSSRSGYASFSASDVKDVVRKLDEDFDVDVMVVGYILSQYNEISQEELYDYFEYELEDEEDS